MSSPSETGNFSASSFGAKGTTFGPKDFRAQTVLSSPRYQELDRREAYYDCTQHDAKKYDWDGRILSIQGPGALATQQLLNREVAPFYVPLSSRRPSTTYRIPRVIVNAFTNMIYGAQRMPTVRVEGDADTQDYATQLRKSTNMGTKMIRLRTIGGKVGTAGLSWCFDRKGRPRVETHNGKYLWVHEWDDREELIPSWVSEVYLTPKDEWDGQKRKYVRNWYWHRRDWNCDEDILFQPVLYKRNQEPAWTPDAESSVAHHDGFCHFAWVQNLPSETIDGFPDYEGLYEQFDQMDVLISVIVKGAVLNLDPTLVLKMDRDIIGSMGVAKGSDNSLVVGEEGDASYLEITGQSLEAGVKLFNEKRRTALETAQCVVPDPSEVNAADVSSIALKTRFAPMLGKCEILREQYGGAERRIIEQMIEVVRLRTGQPITVYVKNDQGEDVEQQVQYFVQLPPKIIRQPAKDAMGQPVIGDDGKPQEQITRVERSPGQGGEIELVWPEYFPTTPGDLGAAATAYGTASGGKPVISQQTAVEQMANMIGVEPAEEWARVQKDGQADQQKQVEQAKAFGASGDFQGGKVGGENDMPPGAKPKPPKFGGSSPPFGEKPDTEEA